jgi:hypothetical protein
MSPARPGMRRSSACPGCVRRRVFATLALLAGCTVVETKPELAPALVALPISIPLTDLGGAAPSAPDFYYRSILGQMQAAWLDSDRRRLRDLLALHDRPEAPDWALERIAVFRSIERVMEFEQFAADRGRVVWPEPLPAIGEGLPLTFQLGPLPSSTVRLPGGDTPTRTRFRVQVNLVDHDGFGTRLTNESSTVVDLPLEVDFAAGQMVEVPVSLDVPAAGSILRQIAVEVWLMPGYAAVGDANCPIRRTRCARGEATLVPRGHEPIAARPLAALQAALRVGDTAHFAHVYLAARVLAERGTPADRDAALAALIDRLRLGNAAQVSNVMASLGWLAPDAAADQRDRAEWLQWWSALRR